MTFIDKVVQARRAARRLILELFAPGVLAAEERRRALNASLQANWAEHNIDVFELIREDWDDPKSDPAAKQRNFIVFIDPDLDIDWIGAMPASPEVQKCISLAESVGAQKCNHLSRPHVLHFRRLLGQAIVNAFKGDADQGCRLALQAAKFLDDRTVELSRRWTLFCAHVIVLIISLGLVAVGTTNIAIAGQPQISVAWICIQGGLVGAYLSIIQKTGRGRWDASAGPVAHMLEVFTKLSAGAILGGCAYAIAHSVHAPDPLRLLASDNRSLFLFGATAGWGERLVPKIISTYGGYLQLKNKNET